MRKLYTSSEFVPFHPALRFGLSTFILLCVTCLSGISAQECVIIIQGFEDSDEHFASNGADALEEAFKNFPGGAKVTKLRPSSNKSTKPGTSYSSKADLLAKIKEAMCKEECKDVVLAFIGHGMGGPGGLYDAPKSPDDGGMWVGEEGSGAAKRSTFIEAAEIAKIIDECKKEVKLLDSHCYATAMYNGIRKALTNKDLLKVALSSSKWNEESKFTWPDAQKDKGFYEFLREFLIDYYKIIGDPNVMEEIRKKADDLKKKAEEANKEKEAERERLRKEIADKEKELKDCNDARDNLEKEIKNTEEEIKKAKQNIADLKKLIELIEEYDKLKEDEKEWSSSKERARIREIKKKYTDMWNALPKAQQTPAKKKELEDAGKKEIEDAKEEFKEKRKEYDDKLDKNKEDREALSKKLKDQGITVSSSTSSTNKGKVEKALADAEKALQDLEKSLEDKKKMLKEKSDKIKELQDAIKALKDKLAAILDHSTIPPVMELVLHYAFESAKANTKSSTAEEPQKPVADSEKVRLPNEKMKTIGVGEYLDGRVIRYKRYLNFYKVKDAKTGNCVVVGYLSSDLNSGWPEQPLISKNCKEDCSVLEVAIKDGDKEIIIKLVRQPDGKYKAEVDGKEEKYREFAFYIPFTPPGHRPEKLAVASTTFADQYIPAAFSVDGTVLAAVYDDATDTGEFNFEGNNYEIAFLSHGAVRFTGKGMSWTQQDSRHFSLYDVAGNRMGEAGFIVSGAYAFGSLWVEDGNYTVPIAGSFDTYTGQFNLHSDGAGKRIELEENDTDGRARRAWRVTGETTWHDMLPNDIPLPYIVIPDDPEIPGYGGAPTEQVVEKHPQIKWKTVTEDLPQGVIDSYVGTRISRKNHATGELSYFDFGQGVTNWQDMKVTADTKYTYCISSATANNMICACDCPASNPPLYSYPVCFDWSYDTPDSLRTPWDDIDLTHANMKIPVSVYSKGFPWVPVIGVVTGAGVVTAILLTDKSESCDFSLSVNTTTAVCGLANGSATVAVNPAGSYTYRWSNGGTTSSISNVAPGSYMVTVTKNGTDCSQIATLDIPNSNIGFTTAFNVLDAHCGRTDGIAGIEVQPPGVYTITWSNGGTGISQANLASGTYGVTVTGAGTCVEEFQVTVGSQGPDFAVQVVPTAASCGASDGSADATVTPPGNYTYAWSDGSNAASINEVPPGSYQVTVTLADTCEVTASVTIDENPADFSLTIVSEDSDCGIANGSAQVTVSPSGTYSFLWSDGSTTDAISGLTPGEYSVTVTKDGTTCSVTGSITIEEKPVDLTLTFTTTPADCGVSNGTAQVTADPPGTYTYLWSDGSTTDAISDVAPGDYSVTVTVEGTACAVTGSVTIDDTPTDFSLTFTTTPAGCGVSTGSATVTADPPGAYTYTWSNGETTNELTNVPAGDYTVTVTREGTTCSLTATVTVDESPADFDFTFTTTPARCGFTEGGVSVVVVPKDTYTYAWSNGATTDALDSVSAGEYVVTVTNAGGCSGSATVTVDEIPLDLIISVIPTGGNCLGEGTEIRVELQTPGDGPMEITATGPDGAHVVMTDPGAINLSTAFNILPGTWTIVVRDLSLASECTDSVSVDVEDLTDFSAMDDDYETTVDLFVSGNVLDNDSGLNISVTDHTDPAGGMLVINDDGTFTFTPPVGETGTFTFQYEVTDTCGNSDIRTVTIQVNTLDCLFDAMFVTTSSNCGLATGAIITVPNPLGLYTYAWSDGETTQNRTDIPAGQYMVTITSVELMCSHEYVVDVAEVPNTYITGIDTEPGNCTGEGEITVTFETPGEGPLVIQLTTPEDEVVNLELPPGTYQFSAFLNITSGAYSITVYDQGAGPGCTEMQEFTVADNTPDLLAVDDSYQTNVNTTFTDNMLDNDSGLNLMVVSIGTVTGGTVEFDADGSFTFTPTADFVGTASFTYTVRDACGNEADALVEILVEEVTCEFTSSFTTTNADCGFGNGSAIVDVDPAGNYLYTWSNGENGPMLTNVGAGTYSVTIEDLDLGCELVFETEVGEDPAEYISNIVITQPACPIEGEIQFDVNSFGGGPFDITITHPNGVDVINVPPGTVILSDFIAITDGDYNISVVDVNAGPECSEMFDATIEGSTTIEIMVEAVIPPTEFSSMDGAIIVVITMEGLAPYTILLDGEVWGVTSDPSFTVEGLGVGTYMIQIQDTNGCVSNILVVDVPPPGIQGLQFAFGLTSIGMPVDHTPEQPSSESGPVLQSFVAATLHYQSGGLSHESSVMLVQGDRGLGVRLGQFVDLWDTEVRGFDLRTQGGLSMDIYDEEIARYLTLKGDITKSIGKFLDVRGGMVIRGWEKYKVGVKFGLVVKVPGFQKGLMK